MMHRPFGFGWSELSSIVTMLGILLVWVRTGITRTAHDSSKEEFGKLSRAIDKLEDTMIKVNMTLTRLEQDRTATNNRLEEHSRRLNRHSTRLTAIETRLNMEDKNNDKAND